MTRLDEHTVEEWREIVRRARPDLTDEQFEKMVNDYFTIKARKQLH